MRGRSRSATLVIAYLMSRFKWNLLKAYRHVKSRRSFIGPHSHLRKQLINYEKHLFGTNSMQLSEFKSYYTPID